MIQRRAVSAEAIKEGDLISFERVLTAYEGKILNHIYHFVGDRGDAEDLAQETFLRVYLHLDSIDPERNVKSWIYRIATNVVFDWLRKKQRSKEIRFFNEVEPEKMEEMTPEHSNQAEQMEVKFDVMRALRYLKPVYQSVLILFYYDGFTQQDIAKMHAMPLGTVKTHLRQARQSLRALLLKNGFREEDFASGNEYGLYFSKN